MDPAGKLWHGHLADVYRSKDQVSSHLNLSQLNGRDARATLPLCARRGD